MRKNDQILMWEAYIGESSEAVSMGGPYEPGGSNKSSKKSSDDSEDAEDMEDAEDVDGDPYEDEEDELHGILKKVHAGDLKPGEAHRHISKMMSGGDKEEDAENIRRDPSRGERQTVDAELERAGEKPLAHGSGKQNTPRRSGRESTRSTEKFRKEGRLPDKRPMTFERGQ